MNEQLNPIFKGLLNPHVPQLDDTIEETGCDKDDHVNSDAKVMKADALYDQVRDGDTPNQENNKHV